MQNSLTYKEVQCESPWALNTPDTSSQNSQILWP